MTGSQQSNELKEALAKEMENSKLMEGAMAALDEKMKAADELLSQMIPKSVSEKVGDSIPKYIILNEANSC